MEKPSSLRSNNDRFLVVVVDVPPRNGQSLLDFSGVFQGAEPVANRIFHQKKNTDVQLQTIA